MDMRRATSLSAITFPFPIISFRAGGDAVSEFVSLAQSGIPLGFSGLRKDGVSFSATSLEDQGRLLILRAAVARGSKTSFEVDRNLETVGVAPPSPFSGEAEFRACTPGRAGWHGSLRVNLPGKGTVALADPRFFGARLKPEPKCTKLSSDDDPSP